MVSWFPERSANFYSVLQERIEQSLLHYSACFAVRQSRVDVMTFQTFD